MTNHPSRKRIPGDKRVRDLNWIEDQYFAGFGSRRLAVADCGPYQIEAYTPGDGDGTRMVIYRSSAMAAAYHRSVKAGGGARGLCSDHLLEGEAISLTPGDGLTVAEAIAVYTGTMERRERYRAQHDKYLASIAATGLRSYVVTDDIGRYARFFVASDAQEAIRSMREIALEAGWPITEYVASERRQARAATDEDFIDDEVARSRG